MTTRYHILLAVLIGTAAAVIGTAPVAVADEAIGANPTADDIIKALTPQRKTRGIRLRSDAIAETAQPAVSEPASVDLPMITFEYID